jgi:exosome complex component MTR3
MTSTLSSTTFTSSISTGGMPSSRDNTEYRPAIISIEAKDILLPSTSTTTHETTKFITTNVVSQASGSAFCEIGNTKVICAIYGPRAPQGGGRTEFSNTGTIEINIEMASFAKMSNQLQRLSSPHSTRQLGQDILTALQSCVRVDTFPKSVLDVVILILQDDGSLLPACINCACMAIASAGIEMFDLVSSCTVSVVPGSSITTTTTSNSMISSSSSKNSDKTVSQPIITINPNQTIEMIPNNVLVTVTVTASRQQIVGLNWHNIGSDVITTDNNNLTQLTSMILEVGFKGCLEIDSFMRQVLIEQVIKKN